MKCICVFGVRLKFVQRYEKPWDWPCRENLKERKAERKKQVCSLLPADCKKTLYFVLFHKHCSVKNTLQ